MSRLFCRSATLIVMCALVAGCLTTSPEQQAKINEERCANRGYKPGTPDFQDCVVRIEGERAQRMESNRRNEIEKPTDPTRGTRGY